MLRMRELADAVMLGGARHGLQIGRLTGMVLQGSALVQTGTRRTLGAIRHAA